MHWVDAVKDYFHIGLGAGLSVLIYKEKVDKMTTGEKLLYVALSMGAGIYLGNGLSELCGIDLASNRAKAISILITVFAIALLGLARDNLPLFIDWVKAKWL